MPSLQEKAGRWYAVWWDGAAKKHRWESLSALANRPIRTERMATQYFQAWLRRHKPLPKTAIDSFFSRYRSYAKTHKRPYTAKVDNRRIRAFEKWCMFTGRTVLSHVDRASLEEFRNTLACGPTTRKRYLDTLRAAFSLAVQWELLSVNPGAGIKAEPNYDPRPTRALSEAEVERVLVEFPSPDREFCALAIFAGLRRADIIYLQWSDIDLGRKLVRLAPKPSLGYAPKSTRHTGKIDVVPLLPRLAAILTVVPHSGVFVFDNGAGKPMFQSENTWTRRIRRTFQRHGIEANIHCLRHTFITRLAAAGVHPFALKTLARHSDLRTTMKYTHLTDDELRRELDKLPDSA